MIFKLSAEHIMDFTYFDAEFGLVPIRRMFSSAPEQCSVAIFRIVSNLRKFSPAEFVEVGAGFIPDLDRVQSWALESD
jgi:hypothetical protein